MQTGHGVTSVYQISDLSVFPMNWLRTRALNSTLVFNPTATQPRHLDSHEYYYNPQPLQDAQGIGGAYLPFMSC
jgi:hypothetical protein